MTTVSTIRSWPAIFVGVFFSLVTCWVLLEDVYHGASVNTKHVMTVAVLAGTIYFGHQWWVELRHCRIGTMLGCTVLFLAGTATCVLMSAGRNAEVTTNKSLQANSVNTDRQRALRDRDEAKKRYEQAASGDDLSIREAKGSYDAAMFAAQTECQTGDGPACKAKRATTSERRKALEDAQANLRIIAQLRKEDLDAAETRLAAQKPEQVANAEVKAAAMLFAQLPGVTAEVKTIEASLLVAFPFLQSLFCEIASICGFAMGIGYQRVSRTVAAPPVPLLPAPREVPVSGIVSEDVPDDWIPPTVNEARAMAKKARAEQIFEALRSKGRPVCNDELAALISCSKGEASRQVTVLKNIGLLRREPRGRYVAISLRPFATV